MTGNRSDEALIERDIDQTQDEMGDTVRKLEDKLNPRDMAASVIGEDGMDTARQAFDVAKRNPMPAALIAIGAVWLFATSDAPIIRDLRNRLTGRRGSSSSSGSRLIPRSEEPAPIGPPPPAGETYDRRRSRRAR